MPRIHVALGVAPENACLYTDEVEGAIRAAFADKHVKAIGSCGLSAGADTPRDVQERAFRRQVAIAKELEAVLVVEAHGAYGDALAILEEVGLPDFPVILRAFDGTADELLPWVEAGCYVSFDAQAEYDPVGACKLARLVPTDRILVESSAPENGLLGLTGSEPRCDQVVFVADTLQGVCSGPQLMTNFLSAFTKR